MPLASDWDAGVVLASGCDHRMLVAIVAAAVRARQRCHKAGPLIAIWWLGYVRTKKVIKHLPCIFQFYRFPGCIYPVYPKTAVTVGP